MDGRKGNSQRLAKDVQILLSNSQAGSGRTVKQEQESLSRNHVQAFSWGFVDVGKTPQQTAEVNASDYEWSKWKVEWRRVKMV